MSVLKFLFLLMLLKIGFITYDSNVHLYNLSTLLKQPQMFVLSDFKDVKHYSEIELPLPEDFLVNLKDSKDLIFSLLDSLPNMFKK